VAAGFNEDTSREQIREVIEGLIDIGDLTAARFDGKSCLVVSLSSSVDIGLGDAVLLGAAEGHVEFDSANPSYLARHIKSSPKEFVGITQGFEEWAGEAGFLRHLSRRNRAQLYGTLRYFWLCLTTHLDHESAPLDPSVVRAVTKPPSDVNTFFGRHNTPTVSGRWSTNIPDGYWCAVRPGRNEHEWHPIIVKKTSTEARALDLFDWDEWSWALLARGAVIGPQERSTWDGTTVAFHYPIPNQFVRVLRLLGGQGSRPWAWNMDFTANNCLDRWRASIL